MDNEKKTGSPTIIPIVGQGGLGKTTLAKMIFNNSRLNGHVESKVWLNVSDKFDIRKLTEEMLKYLSENFSTKDATFDMLQLKLQTELASKKILLILDDVWFVNSKYSYEEFWKQFLAPIWNSHAGSTIIVTTREEKVLNTLKSLGSIRPIYLGALNDDDGWSLLKLKAFYGGNLALLKYDDQNLAANLDDLEPLDKEFVEKLEFLKPIGRNIAEKLKGLPLAIIEVASRLRGEFNIEKWERILLDGSLDNGIIEVLHRSYEHLPAHIQRCFAYCSLFPKNYYLKRDRLVHMWIAHGFVLSNTREKLEDTGESYFSELISRSFIQVIKQGNKEYYVMNDLMNDLACHFSKGECYTLKEGDTLKNLGYIRHLSVTTGGLAHLVNIHDLDDLHTLILLSDSNEVDVADEVFIKMKRIRVMDIDCRLPKLPNIGECKNLHYPCFRYCWSKLAPDTFSNLHHLTVLFIRKGYKGIKEVDCICPLELPQSICTSRLELIDTSKSIQMELGGQVQLNSVWRGGPAKLHVKKKELELEPLGDCNNIKCGLQIGGLEKVTKLCLEWDWTSGVVESNIEHNEILEVLRPHRNIEMLEIWNYPGDKFSSWLESNWLSRLTYLLIGGCTSGFKMLPVLGEFSLLKEVKIQYIDTVRRINDEFYGNSTFPSLGELEIRCMDGLEKWSSPHGVHSFPKLRKLELFICPVLFSLPEMESFCSLESVKITSCPKIRSLPKLPVSLQYLYIEKVHPNLEEQLGNKNGPEWDKIAAVPGCCCQIKRAGRWVVIQKGE